MYIVVLVTASSKKEAAKIAKKLIENKLAACVNIIGKVNSLFWWKGAIDTSPEALLVIKSKRSKFSAIVQAVKSAHSYEVPEIIALPIVLGEKNYLRWIDESLSRRSA